MLKQVYLAKRHQELNDMTRKLLSSFSDYDCELLSVYEKNDVKFSAPLEFLSQLINFDTFPVPLDIEDASIVLPQKTIIF